MKCIYHALLLPQTLAKLAKFTTSLKGSKKSTSTVQTEKSVESYSGQVLEADDDGREDLGDWHQGKLKFKKHIDDQYRMGGDGRSIDDYAVIDSRSGGESRADRRSKF